MDQETLADLAVAGRFTITEPVGIIRCEPIWEFKPYLLKDYLFFGVLDGVGRAWIGQREMRLRPGSCLLIPPGAALTAGHDPKRRLRVFYFHLDFLDSRGEVLPLAAVSQPSMPTMVTDLTTFEPLARLVVEGHTADNELGRMQRDLAMRSVLLRLAISQHTHSSRGNDSKLSELVLAIRENPSHVWTVEELARQAGLSVSQLARRMHQLVGCSPQNFVIRTRIDRACRLMETSNLSLEQIADSLGYTDVYFFHRQFKRVVGLPPAAWRKTRR